MGFLSKENGPCEEMSILMEEVSKLVTEWLRQAPSSARLRSKSSVYKPTPLQS